MLSRLVAELLHVGAGGIGVEVRVVDQASKIIKGVGLHCWLLSVDSGQLQSSICTVLLL